MPTENLSVPKKQTVRWQYVIAFYNSRWDRSQAKNNFNISAHVAENNRYLATERNHAQFEIFELFDYQTGIRKLR